MAGKDIAKCPLTKQAFTLLSLALPEYKKGKIDKDNISWLRDSTGYSILGVLCDLYQIVNPSSPAWKPVGEPAGHMMWGLKILAPGEVIRWALVDPTKELALIDFSHKWAKADKWPSLLTLTKYLFNGTGDDAKRRKKYRKAHGK